MTRILNKQSQSNDRSTLRPRSILFASHQLSLVDGTCDIPRISIIRLLTELGASALTAQVVVVVGRLTTNRDESLGLIDVLATSPVAQDWDTVAFTAKAGDPNLADLLMAARLRPAAVFEVTPVGNSISFHN